MLDKTKKRKEPTAQQMADRFECSPRTIHRYKAKFLAQWAEAERKDNSTVAASTSRLTEEVEQAKSAGRAAISYGLAREAHPSLEMEAQAAGRDAAYVEWFTQAVRDGLAQSLEQTTLHMLLPLGVWRAVLAKLENT